VPPPLKLRSGVALSPLALFTRKERAPEKELKQWLYRSRGEHWGSTIFN